MAETDRSILITRAGELSNEGIELARQGDSARAALKRFVSGIIFEDGLGLDNSALDEYKTSYVLALSVDDYRRCGLALTRLAAIERRKGHTQTYLNLQRQADIMFSKEV